MERGLPPLTDELLRWLRAEFATLWAEALCEQALAAFVGAAGSGDEGEPGADPGDLARVREVSRVGFLAGYYRCYAAVHAEKRARTGAGAAPSPETAKREIREAFARSWRAALQRRAVAAYRDAVSEARAIGDAGIGAILNRVCWIGFVHGYEVYFRAFRALLDALNEEHRLG